MRKGLALAIAAALIVTACGGTEPTATNTIGETTSAEGATTTTPPAPTTTVMTEPSQIISVHDLVYADDADGEWTMSLFAPTTEGPWPVVVVFHGWCTMCQENRIARDIASRGAVAVAPTWLEASLGYTAGEYADGFLFDRATCAVAAAQEIASEYGGDPTATTVMGFSGGIHPATWSALGLAREPLCSTDLAYSPVGLVLGDSQFLFEGEDWDGSFQDSASRIRDTVDRFLNTDRWLPSDDLRAYLWTTESQAWSRPIDSPPAADSWVWLRGDPTMIERLIALDTATDGEIGFLDNALLMEQLMRDAGVDVTHESYLGGHSYKPAVLDRAMEIASDKPLNLDP